MKKTYLCNILVIIFLAYLILSVIIGGFLFSRIKKLEVFKVNYNAKIINIFFVEYSHKLSDASDILKYLIKDEDIDFSYLNGRLEEYFLNNTLTMLIAKEPNIFEDKEIGKIINSRYRLIIKIVDFLKKIKTKIVDQKNKEKIIYIKPDIEKTIFLLNALNEDLQSFRNSKTKKVYEEYEKELLECLARVEKNISQ
ncbi:hypothetical protein Csac_0848 [Caldicellulosiruptor saccharolyticus DSM 8903]|uniref:Uncharacterized protein n=1 Tax=Caldicellulosiruptor saccharolyticus (strain ATCC 43494 / DSM 8903 / Tp8T 6331) TaxID=351627 RepID=A4XHT1_CALS8|nr:hypothetical protein [Caldicellulosiruptor saccharolyticus]ABP66466.1 hypothetical protein Csac_0848 [Caldicellulosiruptor saccharolyticus DSM 8903]